MNDPFDLLRDQYLQTKMPEDRVDEILAALPKGEAAPAPDSSPGGGASIPWVHLGLVGLISVGLAHALLRHFQSGDQVSSNTPRLEQTEEADPRSQKSTKVLRVQGLPEKQSPPSPPPPSRELDVDDSSVTTRVVESDLFPLEPRKALNPLQDGEPSPSPDPFAIWPSKSAAPSTTSAHGDETAVPPRASARAKSQNSFLPCLNEKFHGSIRGRTVDGQQGIYNATFHFAGTAKTPLHTIELLDAQGRVDVRLTMRWQPESPTVASFETGQGGTVNTTLQDHVMDLQLTWVELAIPFMQLRGGQFPTPMKPKIKAVVGLSAPSGDRGLYQGALLTVENKLGSHVITEGHITTRPFSQYGSLPPNGRLPRLKGDWTFEVDSISKCPRGAFMVSKLQIDSFYEDEKRTRSYIQIDTKPRD